MIRAIAVVLAVFATDLPPPPNALFAFDTVPTMMTVVAGRARELTTGAPVLLELLSSKVMLRLVSRNDLNGQLNLDLPLASKRNNFVGVLGELSVNVNANFNQLSSCSAMSHCSRSSLRAAIRSAASYSSTRV